MPDISMCMGNDCILKETCYRYKATPSDYQSYFTESPVKDNECEYYWKINEKVKVKLDKN